MTMKRYVKLLLDGRRVEFRAERERKYGFYDHRQAAIDSLRQQVS